MFIETGGAFVAKLSRALNPDEPQFPEWWEAPVAFAMSARGKLILNPEAIKKLKRYASVPPADFNMVEVMCCEGGCIAGPGTTCMAKKAALMVENYVKTSPNIEK